MTMNHPDDSTAGVEEGDFSLTSCGVSDDAHRRQFSSLKCGSERFIYGQQRAARQRHFISERERCAIL